MGNALLQLSVVILLILLLVKPFGIYLYQVFRNDENIHAKSIFNPIERGIYRLAGIHDRTGQSWKAYAGTLILVNAILLGLAYLFLRLQGILPFNPTQIENMEPTLTFNTAVSFMTNTNLQHYSGESGLSILSQMLVIIMMMFTSASTGLAVCIAVIRGLASRGKSIGNFYEDFVKANVRILLPLSIVITIILVALGVPNTLDAVQTVKTLEGAKQNISMGPVAALESIKHLGTNGGGFFGANSAHPFENPSPLTNVLEMLSMWLIPASLPITYGFMVGNRKQGRIIFGAMIVIFLIMLGVVFASEWNGNPALNQLGFSQEQGSMEGKEVRFGIAQTSLFTALTTAATTGTVNNMHDTLTPLGGMIPMIEMMLNNVFGGEGVGFVNMLTYAILAVFLAGLMVGRTPEFLGRKIETREMKLIVVALLSHPFFILVPSAIAFMTDLGTSAISNPGFHGISQVIYEYTSAAANNGSGFEGLGDNTPFWNITTGISMLFGRYISIIAMLGVAGSMIRKQPVPETIGTFRTDNSTFGTILVGTVFIIGALTFFPVLVLGPITEFLSIR